MTIRRVPSVDSDGKLRESQLPDRLTPDNLTKSIQDIFVEMLANGTQKGLTFAYNANARTISAGVAISTGGTSAGDTTPPGQVTSFAAVRKSATSADLTWGTAIDDVGVTGYRIFRAPVTNSQAGSAVTIGTVTANVRTYTDPTIVGENAYQYSIRAFDGAGNQSATSATANINALSVTATVPTAPQTLTVVAGSTAGTAVVSWQAPASDGGAAVSAYVYARDGIDSNSSGGYTSPAQSSTTRSATYNNLVAGSTYNFTVFARNSVGDGPAARIAYTVPSIANTSPSPTITTMPRVATTAGATSLFQGTTSNKLRLAGVSMWGLQDSITGTFGSDQYAARDTSIATAKSWGANVVRLRFLVSDYNKGNKSDYLTKLKAWRDSVLSKDMYLIVTFWDSLDGDYSDATWATDFSKAFTGMGEVVNALGFDPRIMYEPWNEPNNVSDDQWLTNMQSTLRYWRTTIGYKGVLFINSNVWSHRYDDTRWSQLEALDASLLGSTQHQLVFCRHDYANEYPNKTWDASKWTSENGDASSKHAIFESEFGNYNGDATTVSLAWSQNAASFFATRFGQSNSYVGGSAFLWGPWYDANALTGSDFKTPTEWGVAVRDRFLAIAVGQPPSAVNSSSAGTGTTQTNASGIALPTGTVSNANGIFNLNYSTDFDQPASLGSFPANSAYSSRFDAYQGFKDTSGYGTYDPLKTTFVQNSKLQIRMFTENGISYCSTPVVRSTAGATYSGQTYGRFSMCMRAVQEAGSDDSYAIAFMLWPVDDKWPDHGEEDFPETSLQTGAYANAFHHYANPNGGQDAFNVGANNSIFDWHVYTTEWSPGRITFYIDGKQIGASTTQVYNGPMRWTLQAETAYGAHRPTATTVTRVEVDWLAMWSRA